LARIPQRAIDPIGRPNHNENVRERASRRHATIPAILLLAALVLALLTAERGPAALPAEQPSLSVGDVMVTEGTGGTTNVLVALRVVRRHALETRKPASGAGFGRLRGKDSNLDYLIQSQASYR
jgi:hypothetical protein